MSPFKGSMDEERMQSSYILEWTSDICFLLLEIREVDGGTEIVRSPRWHQRFVVEQKFQSVKTNSQAIPLTPNGHLFVSTPTPLSTEPCKKKRK